MRGLPSIIFFHILRAKFCSCHLLHKCSLLTPSFSALFNHSDVFEHYETASSVLWATSIFCYCLPRRKVRKCFDVKVSVISAVHILTYGSHTRSQELPQTSVKNFSPAFVFLRTCLKGCGQSLETFAAYARSRSYILHAACFGISKECYWHHLEDLMY
jgi:hypothetical protein